jgi:hypothetical protein
MTAQQIGRNLVMGMRCIAHSVGIFASALFVLFIVESGAQVLTALSWSNPRGVPLFLALLLAITGVLVAWRREAIGGAMSLAGGMMILALVYLSSGSGMTFTAFLLALPLLIAGTLHLACTVGPRLALLLGSIETQFNERGRWVLSRAT